MGEKEKEVERRIARKNNCLEAGREKKIASVISADSESVRGLAQPIFQVYSCVYKTTKLLKQS